jgi:hypothetical protein
MTAPVAAVRGAARRVLAVAALTLASLMPVSGLLPGGRDAPAVIVGPYLLPAVPAVPGGHPHGPSRPVQDG